MITDSQRLERNNYIGSSDAAAVLGLSRWGSPLGVWAQKTGHIIRDTKESLALEIGNELEDLVCKLFTKRTGKKVRRISHTIFHPNYPFIAANIDRQIAGENAILEAKTASSWKSNEWHDEEIPQEYMIQCMHQLAVTGKKFAYIAVLIGGNQNFIWKKIFRDEKIVQDIIAKEIIFWKKFVEPKIMPTDIKKKDSEILYNIFPTEYDEEIRLGDQADRLCESRQALLLDKKKLEEQIDLVDNQIKALLKDKAVGVTERYRITWRSKIQKRLDVKLLKEKKSDVFLDFSKEIKSRVLRVYNLARGVAIPESTPAPTSK